MNSALSDTLAELCRQFAAQLPARMDAINSLARSIELAAWHPGEVEALHRQVQHLTNSAGIFGMQSVADAARRLEARLEVLLKAGAVPSEGEWQAISADLDRIDQLARIGYAVQRPGPAADPGSDAS